MCRARAVLGGPPPRPAPYMFLRHLSSTGSGPSRLMRWVEMLELDASIFGGEAPVHPSCRPVPCLFPGGDLALERLRVGQPAVQALRRQDCQLDFRRVQPAPVLGRLVNLQLI